MRSLTVDPTALPGGAIGLLHIPRNLENFRQLPLAEIVSTPHHVRRCGNIYIGSPSEDGFWYVHLYTDYHRCSLRSKDRQHGHKLWTPKSMYGKFNADTVSLGIASLILNSHARIWYDGNFIARPGPGVFGKYLSLLSKGIVCDVVAADGLNYAPGYPEGPNAKELLDELYSDMTPERPPADQSLIIPLVRRIFARNLLIACGGSPRELTCGNTSKIGIAAVDEVRDMIVFRSLSRRSKTSALARISELPRAYGVGTLPKVGSLTSDGKLRRIFPMSLGLETTQRLVFRDIKDISLPYATPVYGPKFPQHRYTYDVPKCDRLMYHYIMDIFKDSPRILEFFLPTIYTPMGPRYTAQFPSGVYCTSIVNYCFTAAILESVETPGYVQGDGIMTSTPISHPHLRVEPDYTINGFDYSENPPRYVNGRDKLTSPRLSRNKKDLWDLRRAIYIKVLHARRETLPEARDGGRCEMLDRDEILQIAHDQGVCGRVILYTLGHGYRPSGWDVIDTETTVLPSHHRPPEKRIPAFEAEFIRNNINV